MLQSWRWYGPDDPVLLDHARQAGATGIVSALTHVPVGEVWNAPEIALRKSQIEQAGLRWDVVESVPVHPTIKAGADDAEKHIEAYKTSIKNLAANGLHTICYNFMPVLDWTRTDLRFPAPNGGLSLRFDPVDFAAYDIHILQRHGAEGDYCDDTRLAAEERVHGLTAADVAVLEKTIIAGLPGAELSHDRKRLRENLAMFDGVDHAQLHRHLVAFLNEVVPVAESVGSRLCIHPDDPPIPLFGLPRVVSTIDDYRALTKAIPSLANGITFCTGSLGARPDNDLAAIAGEFADRIHFAHLRNVKRGPYGDFFESDHLGGDVDMVAILRILLREEQRRRGADSADVEIPMRPDHGHLLLDDQTKETYPGYSAIGRLKGLAELRGVICALQSDPSVLAAE